MDGYTRQILSSQTFILRVANLADEANRSLGCEVVPNTNTERLQALLCHADVLLCILRCRTNHNRVARQHVHHLTKVGQQRSGTMCNTIFRKVRNWV